MIIIIILYIPNHQIDQEITGLNKTSIVDKTGNKNEKQANNICFFVGLYYDEGDDMFDPYNSCSDDDFVPTKSISSTSDTEILGEDNDMQQELSDMENEE